MFRNAYALEPGVMDKRGDTYEGYHPIKDSVAKARSWDA